MVLNPSQKGSFFGPSIKIWWSVLVLPVMIDFFFSKRAGFSSLLGAALLSIFLLIQQLQQLALSPYLILSTPPYADTPPLSAL